MIDLDDVPALAALDSQGFAATVASLPQQIATATELGPSGGTLPAPSQVDSIAVLGIGGSGISGDVLRVALHTSRIFVETVRGFEVPGWVGEGTLVFAVSYSGETEETVHAARTALGRGAKVVVLSTGGSLTRTLARDGDIPVVQLPGGLQPRAALAYLTIPMLAICEKLGLGVFGPSIAEMADQASAMVLSCGPSSPVDANPAKQLARRLFGLVPVVYGSQGPAAVAAYRWKCQFNECSKIPSFFNAFRELNHNELAGWRALKDVTSRTFALVVLRHPGEDPKISSAIEAAVEMIRPHFAVVEQVQGAGSSDLARMMDLIYFGDFTATYLALVAGVDPGPIDAIDDLKGRLAADSLEPVNSTKGNS